MIVRLVSRTRPMDRGARRPVGPAGDTRGAGRPLGLAKARVASSTFDPYLKWLGIRDPRRPPDHYALLGLRPGEDDADVIANAADRQMAHVKTYQTGPWADVSQRLLNELAAARLTLLDPARKREYDRALAKLAESARQGSSAGVEATGPEHAGEELVPIRLEVAPRPLPASTKPRAGRRLVWGALAAVLLATGAGLAYWWEPLMLDGPSAVGGGANANAQGHHREGAEAATSDTRHPGPVVVVRPQPPGPSPPSTPTTPDASGTPEPESGDAPSPADSPPAAPTAPPAEPETPATAPRTGPPRGGLDLGALIEGLRLKPRSDRQLPRGAAPADPAPPGVAPPEGPAHEALVAQFREVYATRWDAAQDATSRRHLCQELLTDAARQADAATRYVLLEQALALAAEAGDHGLATQVLDGLGAEFTVDLPAVAVPVWVRLSQQVVAGEAPPVLKQLETQIDALVAADRWELVEALALAANALVRRLGDEQLAARTRARNETLRRWESRFRATEAARRRLAEGADDPAARQSLGRYRAFDLERWDEGLPLLAAGDDAGLAELARRDLARPAAADGQVQLADDWWALAEKATGPTRESLRRRAAHWYAQARPWLTGLARAKADDRLEQAGSVPTLAAPAPLAARVDWPPRFTIPLAEGTAIELRLVLPATFAAGDPRRPREVTISRPFYLATTELTQGQWRLLMDNNPSQVQGSAWPSLPVDSVSWDAAHAYLDRLNARQPRAAEWPARPLRFRLPTEAEWELACRAGTQGAYPFGDDAVRLKEFAWYYPDNSGRTTHPVGGLAANPWGFTDLLGNVWEWCRDWHAAELDREPAHDPAGPPTGQARVLRGGSFLSPADQCRPDARLAAPPGEANVQFGFRLAADPE